MEPAGVLVLPPSARAPAMARDHVRRLGEGWSPELLDVALLVVSEAVTNAVRYGRGRIELSLEVMPDRVRIEISDGNPQSPTRRGDADGLIDGGRGLYLLDALTERWGTRHHPGVPGKTVWLDLSRTGSRVGEP